MTTINPNLTLFRFLDRGPFKTYEERQEESEVTIVHEVDKDEAKNLKIEKLEEEKDALVKKKKQKVAKLKSKYRDRISELKKTLGEKEEEIIKLNGLNKQLKQKMDQQTQELEAATAKANE